MNRMDTEGRQVRFAELQELIDARNKASQRVYNMLVFAI